MPESSDRWQSMENQPFPTLSVIGDRSELLEFLVRLFGEAYSVVPGFAGFGGPSAFSVQMVAPALTGVRRPHDGY
jgi:hypothetical protein